MAVRQLNDGRQQGPRDENEPCDPHKYISMTESVNRQLNHRERALLYRKTMSSSCMLQCPPQTHTHTHTHTSLYCIYTLLQSHPPTVKINLCVCAFESWHTDSFILEAVITGIVQTSTTASLNLPLMKEKHPWLCKRKKGKKKKKERKHTHTHTHTQLSRYSTTLQSGRQYLCNAHLGMLEKKKKTLKLDQLEEYFT